MWDHITRLWWPHYQLILCYDHNIFGVWTADRTVTGQHWSPRGSLYRSEAYSCVHQKTWWKPEQRCQQKQDISCHSSKAYVQFSYCLASQISFWSLCAERSWDYHQWNQLSVHLNLYTPPEHSLLQVLTESRWEVKMKVVKAGVSPFLQCLWRSTWWLFSQTSNGWKNIIYSPRAINADRRWLSEPALTTVGLLGGEKRTPVAYR